MAKYVMVETVSMFKHRYVVEVGDDDPSEWALDTVTCEEAKEFTQKHLDEIITGHYDITLEDAVALYRKEEPFFAAWGDDVIIKNHITPKESEE